VVVSVLVVGCLCRHLWSRTQAADVQTNPDSVNLRLGGLDPELTPTLLGASQDIPPGIWLIPRNEVP
jgi:hypothetical protein